MEMGRKIIKFKSRGPGTNEKLLAAIEDLKKDVIRNNLHDIVIIWRKVEKHDNIAHWLTDYIWWAKEDNMAIIGMLKYIIRRILNYIETSNG